MPLGRLMPEVAVPVSFLLDPFPLPCLPGVGPEAPCGQRPPAEQAPGVGAPGPPGSAGGETQPHGRAPQAGCCLGFSSVPAGPQGHRAGHPPEGVHTGLWLNSRWPRGASVTEAASRMFAFNQQCCPEGTQADACTYLRFLGSSPWKTQAHRPILPSWPCPLARPLWSRHTGQPGRHAGPCSPGPE